MTRPGDARCRTGDAPHPPLSSRPQLFAQIDRASATVDAVSGRTGTLPFHAIRRTKSDSASGGSFDRGDAFFSQTARLSPTGPATSAAVACRDPGWSPTRLTSPYCVLRAAGVLDDFYSSALSWGRERVALALRSDILLFHPNNAQRPPSRAILCEAEHAGAAKVPSSVAISRLSDSACFAGFTDGTAALYTASESGVFAPSIRFSLPEPRLTGYASQLSAMLVSPGAGRRTGGAPISTVAAVGDATATARRLSALLAQAGPAYTSLGALATCEQCPYSAAVGAASSGLLMVDSRTRQPSMRFGGGRGGSDAAAPAVVPSPLSTASVAAIQQGVIDTLNATERTCGVAWNASGSLIATGTGSGTVHLWSLSCPQAPLHSIPVGNDTSIKALCFHPTNPHELLLGGGTGQNGLAIYDLSGGTPVLSWSTKTSATTTQALFSPDGGHVITAHGAVVGHNSNYELTNGRDPLSAPQTRDPWLGHRGSGGDGGEASTDLGLAYNAMDGYILACDDEGAVNSEPNSEDNDRHRALSPFCLAVWRKQTAQGSHARDVVRREFFSFSGGARHGGECADDGGGDSHTSAAAGGSSTSAPIRLLYTLPGHRSRPLHLATPFYPAVTAAAGTTSITSVMPGAEGEVLGCVVSEAGGDDGTIRFWRVFQRDRQSGGKASGEGGGIPPRQLRMSRERADAFEGGMLGDPPTLR